MSVKRPAALRFAEKYTVDPDTGCWVWLAGKLGKGYGMFYFAGRQQGAHRASWLMHNGEIGAGLMVLHRCDNPPCVNPHHLFLGDASANGADMVAKGRGPKPLNKTHCSHGHEFTPENTAYYKPNVKTCRECQRRNIREWAREARRRGQEERA